MRDLADWRDGLQNEYAIANMPHPALCATPSRKERVTNFRSNMPTPETLQRFIARVEQNAHAEAIEEFYTPDASMQENQMPPRVGRDLLVAHERKVLARAKSVKSTCVPPVFVHDDHVVIRWIFEFVWLDGSASRIEELAYQRWDGERIAQETFFYDPAQLKPKASG